MRTIVVVTTLLLAACNPAPEQPVSVADAPESEQGAVDTAHNSRNALDWPGTYVGTVPCADCEGIRTIVTLRADGSFERELLYLGKSASPARDSGRFAWNDAGSIVTLDAGDGTTQMYQVGENRLFHLDQTGNRITGDLASQYLLEKSIHDRRIEDRRWLLVEVMGAPYQPSDDSREAFLRLDSNQQRASGNNSCNKFFGTYFIISGQRIHFAGNMAATMMACPDISAEHPFMEALAQVDNYSIDGDRLSLNRARMAPLLRFELAAGQE
jgi:copper homeostasis protein (lipoprotein)